MVGESTGQDGGQLLLRERVVELAADQVAAVLARRGVDDAGEMLNRDIEAEEVDEQECAEREGAIQE